MDKSFDPYYKWLGIPPHDQPPHHYRLLGIEVFESDRDVIDAAANRVMSYLKDLAVADEAQYSQKLLNEVSRARLCLLNPEKKAVYDAELKSQLGERSGASPLVPGDSASGARDFRPVDQPAPPPVHPPLLGDGPPPPLTLKLADSPHRVGRHGKKAKRERPVTLLAGTSRRLLALSGALVGLGGLALLLLMFRLAAQPPVVDPRVPEAGDQARGLSQPPVKKSPVRKRPVDRWRDEPSGPSEGTGVEVEPATMVELPEPSGHQPEPGELSPDAGTETPPHEPAEPAELEANGRPPAGEPDDRPPSGLPERADFVDPTADVVPEEEGEQTTAPERVPSEVKPPTTVPAEEVRPPPNDRNADADPELPAGPESESPPEPTLDFRFPFADLPRSVELPTLDVAQLPASSPVGPVYLRDPTECSIRLDGGERIARRSYQFRLAPVQGEAQWDFVLASGDTEARVAQLTIDEDQQLRFAWHSAATEYEAAAPLLANCVLRLSGPPDAQHTLFLRKPHSDKHVAIDWKKGSTRAELEIPHLPDTRSVFLEILGVEGTEIDLDPPPRIGAEDGQLTLELGGDHAPLALNLQLQSRRSLQLTVTPWLLLAPEEKPNLRDQRPFTTKLKERIQEVQAWGQHLEHNRATLPRNLPERHQREQELRQGIEQAKRVVEQLEQLQRRLSDPDQELGLQLRVFFEAADGTPVELLHRGIAERPDEERESDDSERH